MEKSTGGTYDTLSPLSRKAVVDQGTSPRLPDLANKTICELWDAKFQGDRIFAQLRDYLRARYSGIRFVEYGELGNFYGPREHKMLSDLPENLKKHGVDAAIVGIGA